MTDHWQIDADRDGIKMEHASTRSLYRYWNRLRGERPAPERREIEPADISAALSETFILEVIDGENFPFRLAGTRICAAFGREMKGENWLDGWAPADRDAQMALLITISQEAAGAVLPFTGTNERDQDVLFEAIILPLKNRGDGYSRLLGCIAPLERPYWLGLQPVVRRQLSGLHMIWPANPPRFLREVARAPHPVFDEAKPNRRRKHLALYQGGISD